MGLQVKRQREVRECRIKQANKQLDIEGGFRYSTDGKAKKLKKSDRNAMLWKFTPFRPVEVNVLCGKEWHKIKFTEKGRLVLCNHSNEDIDAQLALRGLGSHHRCRCLTVKKHFIKVAKRSSGVVISVPPDLQHELARAKRRSAYRAKRNGHLSTVKDPLTVPFKMRSSVVGKVLAKELRNSSLFNSAEGQVAPKYKCRIKVDCCTDQVARGRLKRWDRGQFTIELPVISPAVDPANGPQPSAPTMYRYAGHSIRMRPHIQSCHGITILSDWWDRVYKQGMAVVDGCIVHRTNVAPTNKPNVEIVTLVRPGSLVPDSRSKLNGKFPVAKIYSYWGAEIKKDKDGQWHISNLYQ